MEIIGLIAVFLVICVMSCICSMAYFIYTNYSTANTLYESATVKNEKGETSLIALNKVSEQVETNKKDITSVKTSSSNNEKKLSNLNSVINTNIIYIYDTAATVLISSISTGDAISSVSSNYTGGTTKLNDDNKTNTCTVYGYIDTSSGKSILSSNYFLLSKVCNGNAASIDGIIANGYTFKMSSSNYPGQVIIYEGNGNTKTIFLQRDTTKKTTTFTCKNYDDTNKAALVKLSDIEFICEKFVPKSSS